MELINVLACPDCRKRFTSLIGLNIHIGKSGHNKGKKITKTLIMTAIGMQEFIAQ